MAHTIYKTEGFVLGGVNAGEANRYISIFTKDLGLVKGVARSVREERSRLRYSLQQFSYGDFSLVRGREVWRIIGASEQHNMYYTLKEESEKQVIVSRLFSLLRRLLQGEEKNEHLFSVLSSGLDFLQNTPLDSLDREALQTTECILVLRVLHTLGYTGNEKPFADFVSFPELSEETVTKASPLRRAAVIEINRALLESQL